MVTIALRNKDTQPSETCSEGYTFLLLNFTGFFSLFLGSINIPHPSRTNFGLRLVYSVELGLGLVFIFV